MKKSVAIGAAVVTTLGTTIASATGAQAVAQTDCATGADYISALSSASGTYDNWITSCLPQYGSGKAEFTISSDVDFPADFAPLTDPSVTLDGDWNASELLAYGGWNASTNLRSSITRTDNGSNPRSQAYRIGDNGALLPFHIHSITRVATTNVSAAVGCNNPSVPYTDAFIINYDPVNITVSQLAGNENWSTTITAAPEDIQVGFALTDGGIPDNSTACVLRGNTVTAISDPTALGNTMIDVLYNVNPYPANTGTFALGDFAFSHGVEEDRSLANTGLDDANRWAWLTAGLAMVAAGGMASGARRRRSRSRSR